MQWWSRGVTLPLLHPLKSSLEIPHSVIYPTAVAQYSNQALGTNSALVFCLTCSRYLVVSTAAIMWKQLKRKPALDLPLQCLWAKWSIPSQPGRQLGTQRARQHPIVGKNRRPGYMMHGIRVFCVTVIGYTCGPQFWLDCCRNPCVCCKRINTGYRNLCLFSCVVFVRYTTVHPVCLSSSKSYTFIGIEWWQEAVIYMWSKCTCKGLCPRKCTCTWDCVKMMFVIICRVKTGSKAVLLQAWTGP